MPVTRGRLVLEGYGGLEEAKRFDGFNHLFKFPEVLWLHWHFKTVKIWSLILPHHLFKQMIMNITLYGD